MNIDDFAGTYLLSIPATFSAVDSRVGRCLKAR